MKEDVRLRDIEGRGEEVEISVHDANRLTKLFISGTLHALIKYHMRQIGTTPELREPHSCVDIELHPSHLVRVCSPYHVHRRIAGLGRMEDLQIRLPARSQRTLDGRS